MSSYLLTKQGFVNCSIYLLYIEATFLHVRGGNNSGAYIAGGRMDGA